ncbi:tRNA(Ile)-lysidine synthase [Dyadobacter jejuensis]|uniref:tRNA(Ile)-lysidine synthase n=1 Tax=Dyadobacter jejuensis TaxID=1082580 RepID=A0A316AIN3_9BACT|nr:tRNA lysidine(34) synthetase TilS [Dyadobacter jejuensis]PWJ57099.1 tRNA(Ile)-lysidine synthase [Dyadobacter jejuensis]
MLDSFLTFINHFNPALHQRPTLLAVSGGVDSMVMLDLFSRAGLPVVVAHCNFGLRGEASLNDEGFVREKALAYGFPCEVTHFQTKAFAKENGLSTQMAARELRYQWFEFLRETQQFHWIATAHHLNDSLETSLLNLVRGTGIAGLKGVPVQAERVIRPLLFASRDQILDYAQAQNISWVEDQSNASLDYDRNLIRHRVVPVLKGLNPSLEEGFRSSSERFRAADRLLSHFLGQWKQEVLRLRDNAWYIDLERLWSEQEVAYRLFFLLSDFDFNDRQIPSILEAGRHHSGKRFYSNTHCLLVDRGQYIIKQLKEPEEIGSQYIWDLPAQLRVGGGQLLLDERIRSSEINLQADPAMVFLNPEGLKFPLELRRWVQGDRLRPFGMKGRSKKVSDLLIDSKMNVFEKDKVRVLVNADGEIIWVVGLRASEKYRLAEGFAEGLGDPVERMVVGIWKAQKNAQD